MRVDFFDFDLPESLIAERPASPRGSARMLVVHGHGAEDSLVARLPQFLSQKDLLVFNDTRVLPARLRGRRGKAQIEILLHKKRRDGQWTAFAKPAKRLKTGDRIVFADDFSVQVEGKLASGEILLRTEGNEARWLQQLHQYGEMPLPPYIDKIRRADAADRLSYQTIFAHEEKARSVAAPTAGLHFTDALMAAIDKTGARLAFVTLHVGGGTFLPVKTEDTRQHVMHSEEGEVSAETAEAVNATKRAGGRVIAIGTTALRALESAADDRGIVRAAEGETDIFITPGYKFKVVDMLFTNFHLPRSTLFMLACAFAGAERMHRAYRHAIEQNYRFYSYGDACLLYRQP